MEEEFNLKEEIRKLKERVAEEDISKKSKKGFKIPYKGKLSKKNIKDNYVTYLFIKNNRDTDIFKAQIDEGTTLIKGSPRLATTDDIIYYKGKPMIIQPEWSVKPFSPSQNYQETVNDKLKSAGYSLLLNRMQKEAIEAKKKMNGMMIIIIIAVIGIAAFMLLGGTKLLGFK